MKIKFNWGTGIFIFYAVFVATLIFVVYSSTKVDRSLVLDDYYSLDLDYQNRYDQIENAIYDPNFSILYEQQENKVKIKIGHDNPTGTVLFYKPSNADLDFEEKLLQEETVINTEPLQAGLWKVKVNYDANGKKYYTEKDIYL